MPVCFIEAQVRGFIMLLLYTLYLQGWPCYMFLEVPFGLTRARWCPKGSLAPNGRCT